MVCLGNIWEPVSGRGYCRIRPVKAGLSWNIESAGTNGYHIGEPPHPLSVKVAKAHGINISDQRSRKFIAEDFDKYDMIYAMAGDVLDDIEKSAVTNSIHLK